jgi:hypothetical protein
MSNRCQIAPQAAPEQWSIALTEQGCNRFLIVACHVQIARRDRDVGVPSCIPNFGQCTSAGQGVADECVPAVVDHEGLEPLRAEQLGGRAEPLAERAPRTQPIYELWRESAISEVITGQEITEFALRSVGVKRTQPFTNFPERRLTGPRSLF